MQENEDKLKETLKSVTASAVRELVKPSNPHVMLLELAKGLYLLLEKEFVSWENFQREANQFYSLKSEIDLLIEKTVERENLEELVKFYSNYSDLREELSKISEDSVILLKIIKESVVLSNKKSLLYSFQIKNMKNKDKLVKIRSKSNELENQAMKLKEIKEKLNEDYKNYLNEAINANILIEKYNLESKYKIIKRDSGEMVLKLRDRFKNTSVYLDFTLNPRKIEATPDKTDEMFNLILEKRKSRNKIPEPDINPTYYTRTMKESEFKTEPKTEPKREKTLPKQEQLVIERHEEKANFRYFCCN